MDLNPATVEEAQQHQPLLKRKPIKRSVIQKALKKMFTGSGHLSNLLPTGTVLTFQFLSPLFTNRGHCTPLNRDWATGLVAVAGVLCFVLCFTDSFRDEKGKVRYGLATKKGLWVFDSKAAAKLSPEVASTYRLRFIDFVHAFMSILVFSAIVLFDQNVMSCFYPTPSEERKELFKSLPIWIGISCTVLFVIVPTKRHGIGFPLSST
ncbi:hypothetical protein CKAN_02579300 [Cinnamomum micranthum f. kanehirae]|uniref:DUF679 domain-containing protein n=1 Tax=Cinnamomum micranthum f. kanehirae TaxID=337451 RepID=A0A3S3NC30_9MAGN|nr:hypothetical protein CKAN_02579300 [Cinnamomum micranthum f. kanehirae]